MHRLWCGKPCGECEHPCELDESMYCSPECECLGADGEMDNPDCKNCDAYLACKGDMNDI